MNAEPRRVNNDAASIKAEGAVYTPPELAGFIADQLLDAAILPKTGPIRILDPAVGDGALLEALLVRIDAKTLARCSVHGYDTDPTALRRAEVMLRERHPKLAMCFEQSDFLQIAHQHSYDLAIANPPYVRTQVLGADQAQLLASRFGLAGRVDLYYAFLLSMAAALGSAGSMGVITSNRFLTTKSGQTVRKLLPKKLRIRHIFDLGDTKLFDAAVLPAITIASGAETSAAQSRFSSIYQSSKQPGGYAANIFDALAQDDGSVVAVNGLCYQVRHGLLDRGESDGDVWRVGTKEADDWISIVKAHTWDIFSRIGKVRVGVKSTADKVFIRSDWELPGGTPELLMPLLTRHMAQRYRSLDSRRQKKILYPHTTSASGRRAAVDLEKFPKTKAYLESHRQQLESRKYVIEGGRQWYEIWVPQDPSAWGQPKLVFPDISEKPTFWMDLDGSVVNGECYFLRSENGSDPELLWLALAVANSSFIEVFYDRCFNNKLYAGRRRWITQYVEKFPLPDPSSSDAQAMIKVAKQIYELTPSEEASRLAVELDGMVWKAFGLLPE